MKALAVVAILIPSLLGTALAAENAPAGKEMLVLVVELPPGATAPPHRHNASVFVYVLEGSVIMQVAGSAPVTLKPGVDRFVLQLMSTSPACVMESVG